MASALPMESSDKPPRASSWPGHWIPWVFIGLFLFVLAVNATMIVIAVSTFTGLETESAYEKGLAYNNRLAAAAEQESWGWAVELDATPKGEQRVALVLEMVDQLGSPITSAEVSGTLLRPVQEGHDVALRLDDQGNGRYAAEITLPLAGQWDIQLTAVARDKTYRLAKRIHVAP